MRKAEVADILARRPFVPLTVYLVDGSVVNVPFSHVSILLDKTLLVMQGVKAEGSHRATGKLEFPFERIARIEPRRARGGQRSKKAS